MTGPLLTLLAGWIGLAGCSGAPEPEAAPEIPEQCRHVHLERLDTDWIAVRGSAADPKTRMRILKTADGYEAWYVGGFFDRKRLKGEVRESDVRFTEIPSETKQKSVEAGEEGLMRLYVRPSLQDCALKLSAGLVDHEGNERVPPGTSEMVQFPEQQGVTFAFQPPSGPIFMGRAANQRALQLKEIEEKGGPEVLHEMGEVPAGTFSSVEADGDPACAYDMDVYFDDQRLDIPPVAAGEVSGGLRGWHYVYDAPYTGNHHLEFHRYRTCGEGPRTLIAVEALEAILH